MQKSITIIRYINIYNKIKIYYLKKVKQISF